MLDRGTNQATIYDSTEGQALRQAVKNLGARSAYFTKKIEFFQFPNGKVFLLEPDRGGQVNLGFKPGFGPVPKHPLTAVRKNSNVKANWRLPNNEFAKLIVSELRIGGAITVQEAVDLLKRFAS